MRDFANLSSSKKNKRKKYKTKHTQTASIGFTNLIFLISISIVCVLGSFLYFDTNIEEVRPRPITNQVVIDFPERLQNDLVLIESDFKNFDSGQCIFFLQVETYGVKKYANEALNIILNGSNLNNAYIEEVLLKKYQNKIFYRVLLGPFKNKSSVNNAREDIIGLGFSPMVKQRCKDKQ
jgi:hypothetical protein